jgi:hypothetical protein
VPLILRVGSQRRIGGCAHCEISRNSPKCHEYSRAFFPRVSRMLLARKVDSRSRSRSRPAPPSGNHPHAPLDSLYGRYMLASCASRFRCAEVS